MPLASLFFRSDHPVFSGHFPGRPVVPGVLLLDEVQHAIESATGLVLVQLPMAKFLSPAVPGDVLELEYDVDGYRVRFDIRCGTRKIATGHFLFVPGDGA